MAILQTLTLRLSGKIVAAMVQQSVNPTRPSPVPQAVSSARNDKMGHPGITSATLSNPAQMYMPPASDGTAPPKNFGAFSRPLSATWIEHLGQDPQGNGTSQNPHETETPGPELYKSLHVQPCDRGAKHISDHIGEPALNRGCVQAQASSTHSISTTKSKAFFTTRLANHV